jgi:hypothetical protein
LKIACSTSVAPRPPYSLGHETPAHPELEGRLVPGGLPPGVVVGQPGAQLVAEGLLGG